MTPFQCRTVALVVVAAFASAWDAHAETYHVTPDGRDAASGSEADPFGTISAAADRMQPGDTCMIHAGTYRETVRPARSGTDGKPIRFVAAEALQAVVSGAEIVEDWTRHEGRIVKAPVGWKAEQAFCGGK